ncbi:MAG: inositol monophosphatase [Acidobacteria bacterium]|nr:inositol monophosphatase [Acidobacteriota bacterium]MBI3657170.1 inositol monophosphatase [Acidobacteriota bacterium]
MNSIRTSDELNFAIEVSRAAGNLLMRYYGKVVDYEMRESSGVLTRADLESDEYIREQIDLQYPEHNILSEELEEKSVNSEHTWIVDPLDGTTNFLKGNPVFSVSIALVHQNQPVLGVVYNPYNSELFFAEEGKGAYLNTHPIKVASIDALQRAIVCIGANFSDPQGQKSGMALINQLAPPASFRIRVNESSALSLCYVAAGRFDAFVDPDVNPWDVAAGGLIVREAGGAIHDFTDQPWNPFGRGVIASNGPFHRDLIARALAV